MLSCNTDNYLIKCESERYIKIRLIKTVIILRVIILSLFLMKKIIIINQQEMIIFGTIVIWK